MDALAHTYATIRALLAGANPLWGERVFYQQAPVGKLRPYVVYFRLGGGADNFRRDVRDASFTIAVKCVAVDLGEALSAANALSLLLDEKGTQDGNTLPMVAGSSWVITTITQGLVVEFTETTSDGELLYHQGHQFEFVLEEA